jgi:UDP-glucuronate decarboxylase
VRSMAIQQSTLKRRITGETLTRLARVPVTMKKRCAETLFFDYHRQHAVEIKIARIFNTYGPRMHPSDGRVVSNFIVQALKGEAITLYGDGHQTRSFCYVDDLIDGLLRLMDSPPALTGPVNLGNPNEFTMRELAKLVLSETGSSSP